MNTLTFRPAPTSGISKHRLDEDFIRPSINGGFLYPELFRLGAVATATGDDDDYDTYAEYRDNCEARACQCWWNDPASDLTRGPTHDDGYAANYFSPSAEVDLATRLFGI